MTDEWKIVSDCGRTRVFWNGYDVSLNVEHVAFEHHAGDRPRAVITVLCNIEASGRVKFGDMRGELRDLTPHPISPEDTKVGRLHIEIESEGVTP